MPVRVALLVLFVLVCRPHLAFAEHSALPILLGTTAVGYVDPVKDKEIIAKVDKFLEEDLKRVIKQLEEARKKYAEDKKTVESIDETIKELQAKLKDRKKEKKIIDDLKEEIVTLSSANMGSKEFYEAVLSAHRDLKAMGLSHSYADSTMVLSKLVPKEKMDGVKAAFITFNFREIDTFDSFTEKKPIDQIQMKARLMDLLVRMSSGMGQGPGPVFEGLAKKDESFPYPLLAKVFDKGMASKLSPGAEFQVGDRLTHLREGMIEVFNGSTKRSDD